MTATLIDLVTEEHVDAPTSDELKTAYQIIDRLWDTIMAVAQTTDLSENDEALASMERDVLLAARTVIHRHMLVTIYPGQHTDHYRVDVTA
jgi:hypothetical protein